jgi:hypothetical protein
MAQADYVVANGTGAAVRSDLNGQLAAIVSNNSGATEPATMYAYQWWANTTTGLLLIRNAANSAWVTVGTLADANLGLLSLGGGTMTGALLADDSATAALPAISFDGDSDTGIFRAGANELAVATNGTGRLFVDSSGRVLVGTSTSDSQFGSNVQITAAGGSTTLLSRYSNDAAGPVLFLAKSRDSSIGTKTVVQSGDESGKIDFRATDGTNHVSTASIESYVDGTPGANDMPGRLVLSTTADGASSPTERVRITSAGLVGIGTTSPSNALEVSGNIRTFTAAAGDVSITHSGLVSSITAAGSISLALGSNNTERARIDTSGRLLVGATAAVSGADANGRVQVSQDIASNTCILVAENTASSGNLSCIRARLTNSSPNSIYSAFLQCDDSTTNRLTLRSNGGLANYSANNFNLSDRNAKKDISPAADTWDCIKEWEIVNYRYKDQSDDADLNLGVIAQQVAESCPEVITVFQEAKEATEDAPAQEERLGVREQQMYWMAIKALQEAQVRIEQLEQRLTDAGIA